MKNYIKSKFDAVINFNGKSYELSENSLLELSDADAIINFSVYPIKHKETSLQPFNVNVVNGEVDSSYAKSYKLKDFNFILLNTPKLSERYYLETVMIGTSKIRVKISTNNVVFENENGGAIYNLASDFSNFKTGKLENLAYCHLKGETELLLVYNNQTQTVSELSAEKININKNSIEVYKNHKTIANHVSKLMFDVKDISVKLKSEELFYKNKNPIIPNNKQLFPIAFIQAVGLKDFSYARKFLDRNLDEKLTNAHLEKFFINFTDHEIIETREGSQTIMLYNNSEFEVYRFNIDNYITNIEAVD